MEKFTLEPLETDTGTFYGIRGPNQFNTVQPSKETAEFVVKACNAHKELLKRLKEDTLRISQLCEMVNHFSAKLGLGKKVNVDDWTEEAKKTFKPITGMRNSKLERKIEGMTQDQK